MKPNHFLGRAEGPSSWYVCCRGRCFAFGLFVLLAVHSSYSDRLSGCQTGSAPLPHSFPWHQPRLGPICCLYIRVYWWNIKNLQATHDIHTNTQMRKHLMGPRGGCSALAFLSAEQRQKCVVWWKEGRREGRGKPSLVFLLCRRRSLKGESESMGKVNQIPFNLNGL